MSTKEILKAHQQSFDDLYNRIEKTISFNHEWHTSNGEIGGAVEHSLFRIIMQQGEMAKAIDNFNRKIILLGTYFGTVALYPAQPFGTDVPLAYFVSDAFAYAVGDTMGRKIQKSALLKDTTYVAFLSKDFFTWVSNVAQVQLDRGNNVSDGMKTFGPPSRRKKHHNYKGVSTKKAEPPAAPKPKKVSEKKPTPNPEVVAYHMTMRRKARAKKSAVA